MRLHISNGILEQVKPENCAGGVQIVLPPEITEIGSGAFRECREIERVVLPSNLKKISEGAFSFCHNLMEMIIPQGVTEICDGAFAYSGLKNVVFPDSLEVIGRKAFTNSKLQTVKIPDSVKQIGYGTFSYCSQLRSVDMGTGLTDICHKAFFGCGSLKNVFIPDTVKHIDNDAFNFACEALFYVQAGSYAHSFAIENGLRVQTDTNADDRINEELLNQCLTRNHLWKPVIRNNGYSVSLFSTLPVHFYCLVEQEAVSRIHTKGLYIPSLLVNHKSSDSWSDGYFFTKKRITVPNNDLVRIKISLKHNPDYINDTTGQKEVKVLSFNDSFLFLDAVHIYPDQCYFLDPYICTESDMEHGILQLSKRNCWDNICHLVIPDGISRVNDLACFNAKNLESVHIGNTVFYIGNDSFSNCPKLSSVYIGESVEASHTRAFNSCPNLQTVTMSYHLKETVMQKKAMCRQSGWPWFLNCPLLERVNFDDGTAISI